MQNMLVSSLIQKPDQKKSKCPPSLFHAAATSWARGPPRVGIASASLKVWSFYWSGAGIPIVPC